MWRNLLTPRPTKGTVALILSICMLTLGSGQPVTSGPAGEANAGARIDDRDRPKVIRFSGLKWEVKDSGDDQVGPGPNYFSRHNVWVDSSGRLQLQVQKREDHFSCAEVISLRSFGYGTYRFYLATLPPAIDRNIVLGLFTWSDAPAYHHREIDIEVSQWGDVANEHNCQFVVQPYDLSNHLRRFQLPPHLDNTTLSFTWTSNSVSFCSLKGHPTSLAARDDVVLEWGFAGEGVPQCGKENARINLWLLEGCAPVETNKAEVIISKFEFEPL